MENFIEIEIEKLIPGGKGISRHNGKVLFVPYVLPGETVKVKITKEKKNFSEAELVEVLKPSKERVEPFCDYYYKCGGCNMQHMNYAFQLKSKVDFAEDLLKKNAKEEFHPLTIEESQQKTYRNRVQVHFENGKMGFKEKASNKVVAISHCPISSGGVNRFFSKGYNNKTKVDRLNVFGKENWYSTEKENEEIHIKIGKKKISFQSSLFFQSNLSILPRFSEYLKDKIQGEILLDLYCGVGLISALLEDNFKEIKAVEINQKVQSYIEKNVAIPLSFYPQSIEKWIENKKIDKKADTIVLDPPRTGLTKNVCTFLNESDAEMIVYVSCDPATLTRDLKEILKDKYYIDDFKLFDFYPQTSHMEAVALLKKVRS